MLYYHEEEQQVGWACSAGSDKLLPDRYKSNKKHTKRSGSVIKGMFEDV